MKKTLLAIALTTSVGTVSAGTMSSGTFTMLDATGGSVGVFPDVTGNIGGGTWLVASTSPFFGQNWTAHSGTTFGPGTYSFDTIQAGTYTGVVVGAGQVGGHILFNWGVNADIDVVNVWDVTVDSVTQTSSVQTFTSTDVTAGTPAGPDGVRGLGMLDGGFVGFNANFDFTATIEDILPPVITLNGTDPQTVVINTAYVEAGAICDDVAPQDAFTYTAVPSGTVDTTTLGNNTISYDCEDASTNTAITVTRTVIVVAPDAVTTLLGSTPVDFECASTGATYVDAGAQCDDPEDGVWTSFDENPFGASLVLTGDGSVDETTPGGPHDLTWTCTDTDGNVGTPAVRQVSVVDTLSPIPGPFTQKDSVGTLVGDVLTLETNDEAAYANLNPTLETVSDSCDTTVPSLVMTSDTVDFVITSGNLITSTLNYTTQDASLNMMDTPLTVNVYRSEPVITLVGGDLVLNVGDAYVEQGIDVFDAQDGSISGVTTSGVVTPTVAGTDPASPRDITVIIDSLAVDTSSPGDYIVTYDVTDFDSNTAAQIERKVTVADASAFGIGNFTMLDASGGRVGGTNDVTYVWDGTTFTDNSVDPATVDSDGFGVPTDTTVVMTISSPTPFNGFNWIAKKIRVFQGPAKLKFDVTCDDVDYEAGTVVCNKPLAEQSAQKQFITLELAAGEIGAHILFDWGSKVSATPCGVANCTIDVVKLWGQDGVWNDPDGDGPINNLFIEAPFLLEDSDGNLVPPALDTEWKYVSNDVATIDGTNGINGAPFVDGAFLGFHANFNLGPASSGIVEEREVTTIDPVKSALSMGVWSLLAGLLAIFGLRRINNKN